MLEHDPSFPEPRRHREFLWEKSRFREVLPIRSEELRAKIHQTYRGQYVQVRACVFGDTLRSVHVLGGRAPTPEGRPTH